MIKTIRSTIAAAVICAAASVGAVSPANAIGSSTDCWQMDDVGFVCVNVLIMDDGTAYYAGAVMR